MPTNDERREVAARMREPFDVLLQGGYYHASHTLFGMGLYTSSEVALRLGVFRLADLIEPEERTCHLECVKSGPFYDVFRFDCCGKEYSESRTDDGATELPLAVCPFCGARVIQE